VRPRIAVCSWSLCPSSPLDLCRLVRATGLDAVQLDLDTARRWGIVETEAAFCMEGINIISGMMVMQGEDYSTLDTIRRTGGVRPDATWRANLQAAAENASASRELGISLVTFHAGFLPHDPADPERAVMLSRLRELRDTLATAGVSVALETGQESAKTLLDVLSELPGIAVNFDPANMILYGMGEPSAALRTLAPRVAQIHIKDALPATVPGEWGTETVVGQGSVDWRRFAQAYHQSGLTCDLVIEREGGDSRVSDVARAREVVAPLFGAGS
jgi:L-ribulose-5-phosphate 3-epimerase